MKLPKIKLFRFNRNHKFLLKTGVYFIAVYAITVQMLIFVLNYFM
jgi:hypothetical protein